MRHTLKNTNYIPASVVLNVELVKLFLYLILSYVFATPKSYPRLKAARWLMRYALVQRFKNAWRLALPAFLYSIQNNCYYFALARLTPLTYQLLQQLKILTTALFAVLLLEKRLTLLHWMSLVILIMGVMVVQLASPGVQAIGGPKWQGFATMAFSSLTSGFAGIYYEKMIKAKRTVLKKKSSLLNILEPEDSVWIKSLHLGIFGTIFSAIILFTGSNASLVSEKGLYYGYDRWTLLVIALQALGGVLISLTVKYTDSIVKSFSTSASIVLSALIGIREFNDKDMFVGAALVTTAILLYNYAEKVENAKNLMINSVDVKKECKNS